MAGSELTHKRIDRVERRLDRLEALAREVSDLAAQLKAALQQPQRPAL